MNLADSLPIPGLAYRHYKGEEYVVQGFAMDTATEAMVVIYRPLDPEKRDQCYTRPLTGPGGWLTPVRLDGPRTSRIGADATIVHVDVKYVPRFEPLRAEAAPVLAKYVFLDGTTLTQEADETMEQFRVRCAKAEGLRVR